MSDTSKNKDNSSDGADEAKKMVLRSATNSIRNKKWSEDVDEAEYELDSDGEDTDYGNSSKVSFFSLVSRHIAASVFFFSSRSNCPDPILARRAPWKRNKKDWKN